MSDYETLKKKNPFFHPFSFAGTQILSVCFNVMLLELLSGFFWTMMGSFLEVHWPGIVSEPLDVRWHNPLAQVTLLWVVTIICDGGMSHLSKFYSVLYLSQHGLTPKA